MRDTTSSPAAVLLESWLAEHAPAPLMWDMRNLYADCRRVTGTVLTGGYAAATWDAVPAARADEAPHRAFVAQRCRRRIATWVAARQVERLLRQGVQ